MAINENELGDRMALGLSYSQGGNIGMPGLRAGSDSPSLVNMSPTANKVLVPDPESYVEEPSDKDITLKDINSIKNKVTPDEVYIGMKAELKKQTFKRKDIARKEVIKNLKQDPKYYSKLNHLGIDDDKKNENVNRKYMTHQEKVITDILSDLQERKLKKRNTI